MSEAIAMCIMGCGVPAACDCGRCRLECAVEVRGGDPCAVLMVDEDGEDVAVCRYGCGGDDERRDEEVRR